MSKIPVGEWETIEVQEKIEKYVRGELTEKEEDKLWIEFLAEPEWYRYFDTWLHVLFMGRKSNTC